MSNIFKDLEKQKEEKNLRIFKDKTALNHLFLPDYLPHRQEQITAIASHWIEALEGNTPSDITIYGKTGTGKTAAAKYAKEQLLEAVSDKPVFIRVEYIRCTDFTTEYQVLTYLCQKLGRNVPNRGWTKGEIVNAFRDIFKRTAFGKNLILIVILDEIDILLEKDGDGILYTLTRTENIAVLSISNYLDFKKFIKPRVASSLRDEEIVFPPYDAEQLADILDQRAKIAFEEGVLEDNVIPLCSAMAAKEEGDARYALDLLEKSANIAEKKALELLEENENRVEPLKVKGEYVYEAKQLIEYNKVSEVIMTLPTQQQRVLAAILKLTQENEEITSGKLYEVYSEISKGDSVTYRRIFDFINELEMLGIISTNTVSKGRAKGRTNIINLQCDTSVLEENLVNILY
ncbi:orc1/cdc6 family replication initiation protein [uncultured Methanobrevibacter sp.]|uniref:Cdc6/Cdc18 family protein n=1 Tax=uncultured Methanobrevibacter sp. TaxID=253161 RepID=UPI0026182706